MSRPNDFTPTLETEQLLYRRMGVDLGVGMDAVKISSPLWFEPQTILPIASYYTDYAILSAQKLMKYQH